MAEKGYLGTTGTSNDAANTYTEAEAAIIMKVVASCSGFEGVAPGYLSELACAANGANSVRVSPGGAMVDGTAYSSSANVDVNIPSAVGGGNTRIDRIVVRRIWATQLTRITRIAGVDAAAPAAPAITQTSGTTYDIMLCQVLVNTAGAVTVTDERVWADVSTNSLPAGIVTLSKMSANSVDSDQYVDGSIDTAHLADDAVTFAKMQHLVPVSVMGFPGGAGGAPEEIVAAAPFTVLGRYAGIVEFATIKAGSYAAGSIAAADIAADAVGIAAIGTMVHGFLGRQGGSATNWSTVGTDNYTSGLNVRIQCGAITKTISGAAGPFVLDAVTFPVAFSNTPLVFLSCQDQPIDAGYIPYVPTVSASGFTGVVRALGAADCTIDINWVAIGPE